MAKPKHSREPKIKKSAKEEKDSDSVDDETTALEPAKAAAPKTAVAAKSIPGKTEKSKPSSSSFKSDVAEPNHGLTISVNVKPNLEMKSLATEDGEDRPPTNAVRSSLTLLKNKGPRRRASMANNNISQDEEMSPVSPHTSNEPAPAARPSTKTLMNNNMRVSEESSSYAHHQNFDDQDQDQDESMYHQQHSAYQDESYQEEAEEENEDDVFGYNSNSQSQYQIDDYDDGANNEMGEGTLECPDCGRHFLPEPFSRHIKICKKVFASKRKVFDSSKKRIEGIPELKTLLDSKKKTTGKKGATQQIPTAATGKSNWKEQSMAFREAMRAAREYSSEKTDDVVMGSKPKTPYIDPSLIQCPNCERRFNQKAAERHIPVCKKIIAKPSTLKKGSGIQASSAVNNAPKSSTMKRGWT